MRCRHPGHTVRLNRSKTRRRRRNPVQLQPHSAIWLVHHISTNTIAASTYPQSIGFIVFFRIQGRIIGWIILSTRYELMHARRSTRTTRPTTSVVTKGGRRAFAGTGHGHKRGQQFDRIRAAQEKGPVRKWYKVYRPPAPHIRFFVEKWVLETDLTDVERQTMVASAESRTVTRTDEGVNAIEREELDQRVLQRQQHGLSGEIHGPTMRDEQLFEVQETNVVPPATSNAPVNEDGVASWDSRESQSKSNRLLVETVVSPVASGK